MRQYICNYKLYNYHSLSYKTMKNTLKHLAILLSFASLVHVAPAKSEAPDLPLESMYLVGQLKSKKDLSPTEIEDMKKRILDTSNFAKLPKDFQKDVLDNVASGAMGSNQVCYLNPKTGVACIITQLSTTTCLRTVVFYASDESTTPLLPAIDGKLGKNFIFSINKGTYSQLDDSDQAFFKLLIPELSKSVESCTRFYCIDPQKQAKHEYVGKLLNRDAIFFDVSDVMIQEMSESEQEKLHRISRAQATGDCTNRRPAPVLQRTTTQSLCRQ